MPARPVPADPVDDIPTAQRLSLLDAAAIVVGIVVGAGIFESASTSARCVDSVGTLLATWAIGGCVALVGAGCVAELATRYPQHGGDYLYLRKAYGEKLAFVFIWTGFWVVRPGSVGAMAFVFARYAEPLVAPLGAVSLTTLAVVPVVFLTLINACGVQPSIWTQSGLSLFKVLALLSLIGVACWGPADPSLTQPAPLLPVDRPGGWGLALVLVMWTYGGWNDMAAVAAEVRQPRRNLSRALLFGMLVVTALYLLVNLAFLRTLGLAGVQSSERVASDTLIRHVGLWGGQAISLLICLSCLGAIHGMLFTGSRLYYAAGKRHLLLAPLGRWSSGTSVPLTSVVAQGAVTLGVLLALGDENGFQKMVIFTAPLFWLFFLLVALSLYLFRSREGRTAEMYAVPGYPFTPALFATACVGMLWASTDRAIELLSSAVYFTAIVLVVGIVISMTRFATAPVRTGEKTFVPFPHER